VLGKGGWANRQCNLGALLARQNRPQEAEAAYREAIRLNPQSVAVRSKMGILLAEQGRPQEAEKTFREAIRLNPQYVDAHSNLGVLLAEQGREPVPGNKMSWVLRIWLSRNRCRSALNALFFTPLHAPASEFISSSDRLEKSDRLSG
jgi:tetratricopeptide (TPR) repeat protein